MDVKKNTIVDIREGDLKNIIKNLACCKDIIAPQFGCEEKYYKKHRRKKFKKYKRLNIDIEAQEKGIIQNISDLTEKRKN